MKLKTLMTVILVVAMTTVSVTTVFAASDVKDALTFVITTTDDAGAGSLRQAIEDANAHPGPDQIRFDIKSGANSEGVWTILLQSLLPPITETVTIDGTSQRQYSPKTGPVIEISGVNLDKNCAGVESGIYRDNAGLDVAGVEASGTAIKGLKIGSFCEGISISANVNVLQSRCPAGAEARIVNVTVRDNLLSDNADGNAALDLCNVAYSRLQNNQFDRNGDHMEITRSENVLVIGNEGRDAQDAIEVIRGGHITIKHNKFSDNRRSGIALLFGTSNNHIVNNEISNMATSGIILSDNNVAIGNKITSVGWFGIEIRHGSGNIVSGNTVEWNGLAGIVISAAMFNGLDNCSLDNNGNPVNCGSGFNLGKGNAFDNVISNNIVAFNGGPGILVGGTYTESDGLVRLAARNSLVSNTIYGNAGLGIDLSDEIQRLYFAAEEPIVGIYGEIVIAAPDGPTPNDSGLLANNSQNVPLLISAASTPGWLKVTGVYVGLNPEFVVVEVYANLVPTPGGDPSGRGEGAIFLGTARTDEHGQFTARFQPVPAGTLISATATDSAGNTSEFSINVVVSGVP